MNTDKYGVPSEVAAITRLLRSRTKNFYILLLVVILCLLLAFGIYENFPNNANQHGFLQFLSALWTLVTKTYLNFFATLCGMLISIFAARFLFGDKYPENSAVDAGVTRITQSDESLKLISEIANQ